MKRFGYEIGYANTITKPVDASDPDNSVRIPLTNIEKLYIRMFGIPDIVKHLQANEIFSFLKKCKFKNVLDIGCAQGVYSITLARKYPNCRVTGIDIRNEELDVGKEVKNKMLIKNLNFNCQDIYEIQRSEKFDMILLLQVIEHLEDDEQALKIISALLSKNGKLIITGPVSKLPKWFRIGIKKNIESHYREGYNIIELSQMLRRVGLRIIKAEYISSYFGELIEKICTFLELKAIYLFAMIFPFLTILLFFEKKFKKSIGSGFFIVGEKPPHTQSLEVI